MHPPDSTPGGSPSPIASFLSTLSAEHDHAIPFERFMQEALYHPEFGYYTARIDGVGRHGDFSTSTTLLPELASALTRWVLECSGTCKKFRSPVHLIELGPGDGALSLGIINALPWRLRGKLRLHLVEISPRLQEIQSRTLAKFRKQITWHRDVRSALQACNNEALIFSNEFVDAFPATVLRRDAENNLWEELHVSFDADRGLKELFRPFVSEIPSSIFHLPSPIPPGARIELHLSYRAWLESWLPSLRPGSRLLTIDYGDTVENLYQRRPHGTLRAYFKHQRLEGAAIYRNFGRQDLTCDVNFTDLIDWGESLGLKTLSLQTQAGFTGSTAEAATAFKVLHQAK